VYGREVFMQRGMLEWMMMRAATGQRGTAGVNAAESARRTGSISDELVVLMTNMMEVGCNGA
jgi:hypothetical protein